MSADDPLGYDLFLDDDLDPTGRDASGVELVLADVVHRLTCETVDLIDSPNEVTEFGCDVRKWVGEAIVGRDMSGRVPLVDEVLHRIEGLASARIDIHAAPGGASFDNGATVDILIDLAIITTTGVTLSRTLGVSAVTVEFLSQGT